MNVSRKLLTPLAIAVALSLGACQRQSPPPPAPLTDTLPDSGPAGDSLPTELTQRADDADASEGNSTTSIADRAEQRSQNGYYDKERSTDRPAYAQVISVVPVRDDRSATYRECRDVAVTHRAPVKDKDKIAGTAIGAVVGGLVGNQVGGGRGRDLATVAGAVGGGVAGRKIQENQQNKRTVTSIEQRCKTVNDKVGDGEIIAYDIVYEYGGESHKARVADDPGDRIALPVRSIN
ncbi:MAG: glycine zipper 2TM domain-containing protein [Dokdonella sp.]